MPPGDGANLVLTSCRRLCRHARYSSRTEEREAGLNEQFENSRCSHSEYPDRRLRLKRALVKRLGVNASLTVHNCPSNSDCLTNSYGVARRYTVWDSTSPSPKTEDIPTNMHKFVLWTVLSAALTTSFPAHGQLPSGAIYGGYQYVRLDTTHEQEALNLAAFESGIPALAFGRHQNLHGWNFGLQETSIPGSGASWMLVAAISTEKLR